MVFPFAGAVWPVVIWVCWILVYMAWGDLCYAVVPGSFGIVITLPVQFMVVDYGIRSVGFGISVLQW